MAPTPSGRPAVRRRGLGSRIGVALLALLVGLVGVLGTVPSAAAAPPTAAMSIHKNATSTSPEPGETFSYVIKVQCTAATVSGCVNAAVHDPMPDGITIVDDITVSGANTDPVITPADPSDEFTVTFSDDLGGGDVGFTAGVTVTISVPVQLDSDYPPSKSGVDLPNTATITADNAAEKDSTAVVTPNVPPVLAAKTTKQIDPRGALPETGTPVDATMTGTNASNVPVDEMVISDPLDPSAEPNPFTYLALTSISVPSLADGAEAMRVRAYVNGEWVDGPLGTSPTLPSGVDPADVRGLQFVFTNTAGEGIAPGAVAEVDLGLEQTEVVVAADKPLIITNTAQTKVTLDGDSASSDPASDTYRVPPAEVSVTASKRFDPDTVRAGQPSTATLKATNTTTNTIDSLTVTEPAAGHNNPFDHGLTFDGLGTDGDGAGIDWPRGATEATITYSCDGTPGTPQTTTNQDTLPAPPASCDRVTGFAVTFTGEIVQGAEATIPVGVVTAANQETEEVTHHNTIDVTGKLATITGSATASDEITSIKDRLAVTVGKKISPTQIPSRPGQVTVSQLTGRVQPFPASTADAHQIVVTDPQSPASDEWFDAFAPQSVTATAVPADATLEVQYFDGTNWTTVPGMASIAGPTIVSQDLPDAVSDSAEGLRFVYTSTLTAPDGFAPGTTVAPNFTSSLRPAMADSDETISNCIGANATTGSLSASSEQAACDDVELVPTEAGTLDPIDKSWDKQLLNARSGQQSGVKISWSTQGYTGLQTVTVTDIQNPATTALANSMYDAFDLVRISPITASDDPHLTFDQITNVELYRLPADSTDPADGSWQDATNDPCPTACDGTFPGMNLTTAERADTIGVRLTFAESPTRAQRVSEPTDPPVGTGVAASLGNDRNLHPVFQLRDELRSNSDIPVTAKREYNITGSAGEIRDTARMTGVFADEERITGTDRDDIALRDVPVTVDASKTWTGGPMSRPDAGVPQDDYPTGRATISAKNTTPAKVDRLVLTDPVDGTTPFEQFNLAGFVSITSPASIGATDLAVVFDGSNTCTDAAPCTRAEVLALTEDQLAGVTGMTLTYTGRIDAAATASATFDMRLRTTVRSTSEPTSTGSFDNTVGVEASDLVGYPGVTPRSASDDATDAMRVRSSGIDVHAAKSFDPTTITEPSDGPVTVALQGQPDGVSRTVAMVLTDTSPTFFNAYDFARLQPVDLTAPIDRVQVDTYVGGSWSLDGAGEPQLTGGHWVSGTPVAGPAVSLPDGVAAGQVQGLRYTFTRADGANWENPAHPIQKVHFDVTRRSQLHTGGPVPSDLAGSTPAPGETVAGDTTNTVTAEVTSSDTDGDGDPLTARDQAQASIHYAHAHNAVKVRKSPNGQQRPGRPFTYTLTVTNTGDVAIDNPVITDHFPVDGDGPMIVDPELDGQRYTYTTSDGSGMPTEPDQVSVAETDTGVTFKFPDGTTLPTGATYTISFAMQTRPGLAANTPFTNTFGITGDRPWDSCDGSMDADTGECRAKATNTVLSAGALAVDKQVKAEGTGAPDNLGTTRDPLVTRTGTCESDSDGFYSRPCVPIAKPGGEITWRMHFVNTGNRPIDRIVAVDRLPAPGDSLATAPVLQRGSQWRPLLDGPRPTLAHGAGTLNVWYTTAATPCTLGLGTDATPCPEGSWSPWPAGANLPVDADTVTGLKFEVLLPDERLAPAAALDVDFEMVAPAFSPTAGSDTIAYNTVGMSGRWVTDTSSGYTLTTEPARVGAALATGPLRIVKHVSGEAAGQYAPDEFTATLTCTSRGQPVSLTDAQKNLTLVPNEPVTVDDLPYLADCTVTEGDHGQTSQTATTATVQRERSDVETVTLTNDYDYASLTVGKTVDSAAADQDDTPVSYGPFTVGVACTLRGDAVYAAGFGPGDPMTAKLSDDDVVTFTKLPAGAECTVTESDDKGAASTTITTTAGDADPVTSDGTEADFELAPDPTPYTGKNPANTAQITNDFDTGTLALTKTVTGDAADAFGAGPFTVHVTCSLDDASGTRTVYDASVTLGGDEPLTKKLHDLATGASCTVTETDDGGATATTISPADPVTIGTGDQPVDVTVANDFAAGTLKLTKTVNGDAADFAPDSFEAQVRCTADGETLPGFPRTVTLTPGETTEVDTLRGATCTANETETGQATEVSYDPADDEGTDDGSGKVVIPVNGSGSATIAVTNTYRAGALQISKLIDGPGAALSDGPFTYAVTCAFNGDADAYTDTVVLTRDPSQTSLTSDVIGSLPVGSVCTITETGDDGADATPPPVTVTIPDVDSDGKTQVVVAGFVNTYSAATLRVSKVVDGAGAARADGSVFTIDVTCQVAADAGGRATVYSGSITLAGGKTKPITATDGSTVLLPLGAHCWAAEPDNGGASKTTIDHHSWDDATIVEAADQTGAMTITVTNTFDPRQADPNSTGGPDPQTDTGGPDPQADTGGPDALADTGGPDLELLLVAILLLLGGATVLVRTRRRRDSR